MQALHDASARSAEHRFATIGFVGALHIAFIYAVLVTLGYVPPPTHFQLVTPSDPDVPKPKIDLGPNPGGGGINPPPGGTGTPAVTFVPPTALTGTHTIPAYPAVDRRLDHEGVVRLRLTIDAQGAVSDATVEKSSGYDGLDSAAIDWVKTHWRYKPATRDGIPMPATASADVLFRLTQG